LRALRPRRSKKEWRSASAMPPTRDYFAWLDSAIVQNLTILALIMLLGFFAQNLTVGMVLLGLYAPATLLLRLPSDVTFKVALLGLIALPALTIAGQQELVSIYAQYVFLLLVIGTLGALVEQWRHKTVPLEVGSPVWARSKLVRGPTGKYKLNMQLMQGWETT
jgi:hypothetical protein